MCFCSQPKHRQPGRLRRVVCLAHLFSAPPHWPPRAEECSLAPFTGSLITTCLGQRSGTRMGDTLEQKPLLASPICVLLPPLGSASPTGLRLYLQFQNEAELQETLVDLACWKLRVMLQAPVTELCGRSPGQRSAASALTASQEHPSHLSGLTAV